MRVPVNWLRDYVPVEMPLDELATKLSVASAEVRGDRATRRARWGREPRALPRRARARGGEASERGPAAALPGGRGGGGAGQIVCGAWNFGEGAVVAVALPGAVLADGLQLEARASAARLARDDPRRGGGRVSARTTPGSWFSTTASSRARRSREVLPLVEDVLLVEATRNRPDLLSIYGIAREVAAIYDLELAPPPGAEPERAGDEPVDVQVEDLESAHRGTSAGSSGTFGSVPSPIWLKRPAARGRHATDLECRRHHELRDARAREPAARLRLRHAARRPHRRPARATRARSCARSTGSNGS